MPKYSLQILGCQMNYSDAERIAAVLSRLGWSKAEDQSESQLVIFVTCSVKQKAEDKVYGYLKDLAKWKAAKTGRQIALTGCMVRTTSQRDSATRDPLLAKCPALDFVWRVEDTARLGEWLSSAGTIPESGSVANHAADWGKTYFSIEPARVNRYQVTVPIMTGCDNFCSYCVVPLTRGRETSRDPAEVVAECVAAVRAGAVEVTLLGQNVNSYAKRKGAFAGLLERVAQIPGLLRVRFTSSHPKDFDETVIAVMVRHANIERHLHLPAQHGDDEILRRMQRHYSAGEYLELVHLFRAQLPGASVTTDLIVGYPGESETAFANLLDFYRAADFDFAYVSQYSPRPGTAAAAEPDQLSAAVCSERWHRLDALLKETCQAKLATQVGRTLMVLFESCVDGVCMGRSSEFHLVRCAGSPQLIGQIRPVQIVSSRVLDLSGQVQAD